MAQRLFVVTMMVLVCAGGASAQSMTASSKPLVIPAYSFVEQSQADWQRQYDQARATKSSGKQKMLIGLGVGVGAVVVANLAADSCVDSAFSSSFNGCEGERNTAVLAGIGSAAGGAVFIWGLIQYMDGNGEMRSLESRRPSGSNAALSFSLGEHSAVDVAVGRGYAAGYRFAW